MIIIYTLVCARVRVCRVQMCAPAKFDNTLRRRSNTTRARLPRARRRVTDCLSPAKPSWSCPRDSPCTAGRRCASSLETKRRHFFHRGDDSRRSVGFFAPRGRENRTRSTDAASRRGLSTPRSGEKLSSRLPAGSLRVFRRSVSSAD